MKLKAFILLLGAADRFSEFYLWLKDFRNECGAEWPVISNYELSSEVVNAFANEIYCMVQARLISICTEALYKSQHRSGYALLKKIAQCAQEQGINVETNVPITFFEIMRAQGLVMANDEGGIYLTQKGSQLADEVRQQVEGNV